MSFTIQAARKRLPTKYSEGLGISFNSTSIIDMAAGACRDRTDVLDLINTSTKTANAAIKIATELMKSSITTLQGCEAAAQ